MHSLRMNACGHQGAVSRFLRYRLAVFRLIVPDPVTAFMDGRRRCLQAGGRVNQRRQLLDFQANQSRRFYGGFVSQRGHRGYPVAIMANLLR